MVIKPVVVSAGALDAAAAPVLRGNVSPTTQHIQTLRDIDCAADPCTSFSRLQTG
jgi:hypothetical protein